MPQTAHENMAQRAKGEGATLIDMKLCEIPDKLLAWEVVIAGDMGCITFAATAAKARWNAVHSYWEAGFGRHRKWPSVRAKRVPSLDNSPLRDKSARKCWVPEYAYANQ